MVDDSETKFATNLLNNLMETWILPSITRRQETGEIEKPLHLRMAQIIFKLDDKPLVRINSEVRGQAKMETKPGSDIRAGDPVYDSHIQNITSFILPDDERDWGHATVINSQDRWYIFFDFIYNRARCEEHLVAAREFLTSSKHALESGMSRVFVDNLASASELAAKAYLLSQPDKAMLRAKTHSLIHSKINTHRKAGNVEGDHIEAFNLLHQLRYPARYLDRALEIDEIDFEALLTAIEGFIDAAESRVQFAV